MAAKGKAYSPAPLDFHSDKLRILAPCAKSVELARARILNPRDRLVDSKTGPVDDPATVKVALLLVRYTNPDEYLTNEEEGLLRGQNADTIGKLRQVNRI